MELLRSFLRRHLAGKPVVASPNVGCFLRLQIHNKLIDKIWVGGLYSRLNRRKSQCQCRSDAKTLLNFRNLYQTLMNTGWKVARSFSFNQKKHQDQSWSAFTRHGFPPLEATCICLEMVLAGYFKSSFDFELALWLDSAFAFLFLAWFWDTHWQTTLCTYP